MNFKRALAAGLLLLVAASIATPIVRRLTVGHGEVAVPPRPDCLMVCYLRANVRCAACRTLEACSCAVVAERFPAEAADGRIQWLVIDYQTPGNGHFISDYQLLTGGVVLVEFREGRPVRWRALPETWNMTGGPKALSQYLEEAIRSSVGFSSPSDRGRLKPAPQEASP